MIRTLQLLIRQLPHLIPDCLTRWVLDIHSLVDAEPGVYVRCREDGQPWPCPTAADAADRLSNRARGVVRSPGSPGRDRQPTHGA